MSEPTSEPTAIVKQPSYTIELDDVPMVWNRVAGSVAVELSGGLNLRGEHYVSESDRPDFIPPLGTYVGSPILPNHFCRFYNRKRAKYCGSRAGARTSHKGIGRCSKHDGGSDKRTRHGLTNRYLVKSEALQARIDRMAGDPALLDMRNELAILCALLDDALDKADFDRPAVERLAIEVNRVKERIHAVSAKSAYSMEEMSRLWRAQRHTIEMVLADNPELCTRLLDALVKIAI